MKFLFSLVKKYPGLVIFSVFISMIAAGAELFGIGLLIPFMHALKNTSSENIMISSTLGKTVLEPFLAFFYQYSFPVRIRLILSLFFLAVIMQFLSIYGSILLGTVIQKKVGRYLGNIIYRKLLAINLTTLNNAKSGYFYSILSNHCLVTASLASRIIRSMPHILITSILIGVLCKISWIMTLVSILILVFTSSVVTYFHKLAKKIGKEFKEMIEKRNSLLLETIVGLKTIKQFIKENLFYDKHEEIYNALTHNRFKIGALTELIKHSVKLVSLASLIFLLFIGTYIFDISSNLWLEGLILFVAILSRLIPPMTILNDFRVNYTANKYIVNNVASFLEDENINDEEISPGRERVSVKKAIEFNDVYFQYSENNKYVLKGLSLKIAAGKVTSFVGSSGVGKSTIVDLLFKFYKPVKGQILIDGTDLQDISTEFWRSQIGIVSQDTFLFNDTVSFNISFGNPDITQEQIVDAAKLANCYDFIQKLPEGFNTELGDRGVRISVGQRQRIAIARAFILNPQILILDEATSNLDAVSEQEIKKAIEKLMTDRTVIAITHRLSTIRKSDTILVLEDGNVVESGVHDQLISISEGRYQKFVELSH